MKEHPILFTSEMICSILDGRKTQTRRIVKAKPPKYFNVTNIGWLENTKLLKKRRELVKVYSPGWYWIDNDAPCGAISGPFKCPYGKPGDMLWCKEKWRPDTDEDGNEIFFHWAQFENPGALPIKWKSSRYMPKKAARIWLKVTDVRVERVQDISEEDAVAEGWSNILHGTDIQHPEIALRGFRLIWDLINKKRGYGWDVNPFVWVIEFKVKTK